MSDRCKSRAPQSLITARLPRRADFARLLPVALMLGVCVSAVLCFNARAALAGSLPAAPAGKSYFFATREACNASGVFTRQECAMAFANALAELRDRAPTFRSVVECRIRFALCETRRDRPGYSPVGLGVEIILSSRGPRVTPAMAVETPGSLFPQVPITSEYVGREEFADRRAATANMGDSDILPADRFEPFAKRPQIKAQFSFNYASLGEIEGAQRPASQETPEQRRARLRAAPFVQ